MKTLFLAVGLSAAAAWTSAEPAAGAAEGLSFAEPPLVPRPRSIAVETNLCVRLDGLTSVSVACGTGSEKAVSRVRRTLKAHYGVEPVVAAAAAVHVPGGEEAYRLETDGRGIRLLSNTDKGVIHALSTLRQSVIAARGTVKTAFHILPGLKVEDAPSLPFRGLHLCWFPGVSKVQMERYVRLAAYYKFNYVVIEPWGVFKWRRNPAFCWPDAPVEATDMRRLTEIGRELGVTLIPQLNVFGHAAMSRYVGGKHATLDFGREYEPLFEPLGWNWCLSNPETRRILFEMADELVEAFGNPPYFHIGCDEAEEPSCPVCRATPYARLVADHIVAVRNHLAERCARAMMWHDMLLDKEDPRWKGFYAKGDAATAAMIGELPRDIVICDWYYSKVMPSYPTLEYFKGRGFEVLTCPWLGTDGIAAQGAAVRALGLKGILGTTWNHGYGQGLVKLVIATAHAAWGTSTNACESGRDLLVGAAHLRQVGWDMKLGHRDETGFNVDDVPVRNHADMFIGD